MGDIDMSHNKKVTDHFKTFWSVTYVVAKMLQN